MRILKELVYFEYKKILKKRSSRIALLIAILLTPLFCVAPLIGNYYINGQVAESHYDGMLLDRTYQRSFSGRVITTDLFEETTEAYSKIPKENLQYSATTEYNTYARPYSVFYYMLRRVYRLSGIEELATLTPEKLNRFYEERQNLIQELIQKTSMKEIEKEASIQISEQVTGPFTFQYNDGYARFFSHMYTCGILLCFIIAICLSPIFSGEYSSDMDSLIRSSRYGKNKIILAKIFTGLSFTVLLSLVLSLISYLTVMTAWGWDGRTAPLQLYLPLCIRPLTMGQAAFLYVIIILFGNLFSASLTMLLSTRLKTPFTVIVLMTVLTVFPGFVSIPEDPLLFYHIWNLLPVNMFYFSNITDPFTIHMFGQNMPPYVMNTLFAVIMSLVTLPFIYRSFKNHNVN